MLKKNLRNKKLKKQKSFSLIEIFISLFLLALILIIAIPNTAFFEKEILKSETEKLFSVMLFLQQKAIATNKPQKILLNTSKNQYSYETFNKTNIIQLNDKISFDFLKDCQGPPADPKNIITKPITFPLVKNTTDTFVINFFCNGKLNAGTIYLINKKNNYMMAITTPISNISFIRKYYLLQKNKWRLLG